MSRVARLGFFIVATLAILATGIFIIGSKEYLFRPTYELKAQFANVMGLVAGADVRVGGVHTGTVRSILLPDRPDGKITVVMDMDKRTRMILKKDSIASIETEGLLGNQYMAVSFGSLSGANLRDGDFITGQPPLEMGALLKKASGILDSGQQAVQNVNEATAHIKSVTAKVDSGQGTVGALVNDKALYANLKQTSSTLNDTASHAQLGVTDFQENMEALKHNFFLRGYYNKRGYEDSSELTANEVERLPSGQPVKTFTFQARDLFDGRDSAKLKNQKPLAPGGEFLAGNAFGFAVITAAAGSAGDSQKTHTLTEARAAVVREYLVEHYGFDDTRVRTLGLGKQAGTESKDDWGAIQILIYSAGTEAPPNKPNASVNSAQLPSRPAAAPKQ